ncbi:hypothetical protein A2U01_0009540, partial [Trifolium medium]|nr:hypothetical protein [Trifolium medium]
MSRAQRGRGHGRPMRNAEEESEEYEGNPNTNMQAHIMHQHQQFQAQQAQRHQEMMMLFQQQMNIPQNQNMGGNVAFREFCRMNPPEFVGEYVLAKAREWIQRMGDILESMECSEVDKVTFVTSFVATLVTGGK